jgi:hypothetical protein
VLAADVRQAEDLLEKVNDVIGGGVVEPKALWMPARCRGERAIAEVTLAR